jgi:hypothetical protein
MRTILGEAVSRCPSSLGLGGNTQNHGARSLARSIDQPQSHIGTNVTRGFSLLEACMRLPKAPLRSSKAHEVHAIPFLDRHHVTTSHDHELLRNNGHHRKELRKLALSEQLAGHTSELHVRTLCPARRRGRLVECISKSPNRSDAGLVLV